LLRILSGLTRPSAGMPTVLGRDVRHQPAEVRRLVGVIPSGDRTFDRRLSGLEDLLWRGVFSDVAGTLAQADVFFFLSALVDPARMPRFGGWATSWYRRWSCGYRGPPSGSGHLAERDA